MDRTKKKQLVFFVLFSMVYLSIREQTNVRQERTNFLMFFDVCGNKTYSEKVAAVVPVSGFRIVCSA